MKSFHVSGVIEERRENGIFIHGTVLRETPRAISTRKDENVYSPIIMRYQLCLVNHYKTRHHSMKLIITYSWNLVTARIAPNDTTTLFRHVFIGHFTCVIGTKTHLFTFNVSAA